MSSEQALPTVRVQNPNDPDSFMIINERDLKPHHKMWTDEDEADRKAEAEAGFTIVKGGRGRFYVKRNGQIVTKAFVKLEDAEAERDRLLEKDE